MTPAEKQFSLNRAASRKQFPISLPVNATGGSRFFARTLLLGICAFGSPGAGWSAEPLFERDVLPVLTKNCLGCHGGLRQKGGLDMRTIPAMLKGGESGPALSAGKPDASEIWKMIASDEMPKEHEKLSAADKRTVRDWIAAGMPTVAERQRKPDPLLPAGTRHVPARVAAAIDQHLDRALAGANLKPAALSGDAEFLRRIYLDLAGRVPTAAEAAAFLDDTAPAKRPELIDKLLATADFGAQFGRTWREWISPPELPSDANGGKQPHNETRALGEWLGKRFASGDSWDRIVRDIITVEGELKGSPHAIFFGLAGEGGKITADGSARAVASLFMGVQLQCAQCHDDPFRSWAQKEHWGLAAFFGGTSGDFNKVTETQAKNGARIKIAKAAFLNAGSEVPAAFLGGGAFDPGKEAALRPALADWLVAKDNPFFAKAFANRTWFYFFARGIVNPVDDMRELNPPSHPGLLALLGNEFTASGFDVKHLIRCICNSRAYQRTSRPPAGMDSVALDALARSFGRMPLRVMPAESLYGSLCQVYGDPKLDLRTLAPKDGNSDGESAAVGDPYLEFKRRFFTNEEDATDFTHGIPQALAMLNHPRLLAGSKALETFLKSTPAPSPQQTVEWLYLSTLSRRPAAEESADALAFLGKSGDAAKAHAGLLWTLVNRSEYIFTP